MTNIFWSPNGQWATIATTAFYRTTSLLTLVDKNNEVVLEVEVESMTWSANSQLAFCNFDSLSKWTLSVWNGKTITQITENQAFIAAQWLGSSDMVCSHG